MKFTLDDSTIEYGGHASTVLVAQALQMHTRGELTKEFINEKFLLHHLAGIYNWEDTTTAKLFLSLGADINLKDPAGNAPIHILVIKDTFCAKNVDFIKSFITPSMEMNPKFGRFSDELFAEAPYIQKKLAKVKDVAGYLESGIDRSYSAAIVNFSKAVSSWNAETSAGLLANSNTDPNQAVEYLAKRIVWAVKSHNTSSLANIEEHPLCLQAIELLKKQTVEGQNWTSLQEIAKSKSHLAEVILGNMEEAARDRSGR